jgi:hypothetical protein
MHQKPRRAGDAVSFEILSADDGKRRGRQVKIAIPRLVRLPRQRGEPHSQDCHEFDYLPLACSTGLNMKRSLCTGRLASAERLLAEGEDYSRVEGNVNGYFRRQIDFK